jgi:hypothetical protein
MTSLNMEGIDQALESWAKMEKRPGLFRGKPSLRVKKENGVSSLEAFRSKKNENMEPVLKVLDEWSQKKKSQKQTPPPMAQKAIRLLEERLGKEVSYYSIDAIAKRVLDNTSPGKSPAVSPQIEQGTKAAQKPASNALQEWSESKGNYLRVFTDVEGRTSLQTGRIKGLSLKDRFKALFHTGEFGLRRIVTIINDNQPTYISEGGVKALSQILDQIKKSYFLDASQKRSLLDQVEQLKITIINKLHAISMTEKGLPKNFSWPSVAQAVVTQCPIDRLRFFKGGSGISYKDVDLPTLVKMQTTVEKIIAFKKGEGGNEGQLIEELAVLLSKFAKDSEKGLQMFCSMFGVRVTAPGTPALPQPEGQPPYVTLTIPTYKDALAYIGRLQKTKDQTEEH